MTTVLIVDDERDMGQLIQMMLAKSDIESFVAENGTAAYEFLALHEIDLVLLDVMMPGEDGFTVCTNIRQFSNVPIIFLTARDANEDKVNGLMLGADDYMVKPFTASELVARITAVLRRTTTSTSQISQKLLQQGQISIDEIARKVYVEGQQVPLTLKEYELLYLFMQKPNQVFSRDQLLERVWQIDYIGGTRTVDTHMKTLRLKLSKFSKEAAESLQTVWGVGYRFDQPQ